MFKERQPVKVAEAVNKVMSFTAKGEKEYIDLMEAEGRYLAEDILADHPIPPFDRSPLDGFAIRSADTNEASKESPVQLTVKETVGAGNVSTAAIGPGEAVRVMTGTIMPKACDAVVMFELADEYVEDGLEKIQIKRRFYPDDNVSKQGEETSEGEVVVKQGSKVTSGVIAVLATFGYDRVPAVKRPVVGIYATGTELLDVNEKLEPGKIRNSNAYMVASQVREAGAEPLYFGKLADDFDTCYEAVKTKLNDVDALITTGGVSVGDFDFLPEIYAKLGADVLFNKIAMRPGSVTTVAAKDEKLLFGLSGNPSACFVGFELYARPWIKSYLGSPAPYLQVVRGTLTADFPKPNPFTRFIRSKVEYAGNRLYASPVGMDKSQVVTSLAYTDCLAAVPGGSRGYHAGDEVDILLLNPEGSSEPIRDPEKKRSGH
ncbi:gephyrin-like molybdotransferase Glp [Salisediminibacterium halotolerans]|uniref:molybdopterin molybdotransferase MoeA n=1 Tax=Salisediminibacterium halotolerans TaxID=517425 RepID=UPI000EB209CD|nr:gephyrin-like molybdotransferase Glp [Salisediminibacterium halotolerans]RLJ74458.1 molybdopterin molybdochelatase [Actinophytocola xinjiangensis]RPE87449.1 molybdopterin molybdochelatase [Salisediminibacterium halotolerans]TWG35294.1 molybdopterin molybdochelatase [Salisediminibacterium halotolerans]GEL06776.1 molybdopterin molybdenumtransferase [Salisediminibacterium halotolerans]